MNNHVNGNFVNLFQKTESKLYEIEIPSSSMSRT